MNLIWLTTIAAVLAAIASLVAVHYQRHQVSLLERQISLAEQEFERRLKSISELVHGLEDEKRAREASLSLIDKQATAQAHHELRQLIQSLKDIHYLVNNLSVAQVAAFSTTAFHHTVVAQLTDSQVATQSPEVQSQVREAWDAFPDPSLYLGFAQNIHMALKASVDFYCAASEEDRAAHRATYLSLVRELDQTSLPFVTRSVGGMRAPSPDYHESHGIQRGGA